MSTRPKDPLNHSNKHVKKSAVQAPFQDQPGATLPVKLKALNIINDTHLHDDLEQQNPLLDLRLFDYLKNLNTGIIISDENGVITWINEELLDRLEMGPELKVLLGKKIDHFQSFLAGFAVHPAALSARILELQAERKIFIGEEFSLKTGAVIALDYIPVHHMGHFYGVVWQLTDITKRVNGHKNALSQNGDGFIRVLNSMQIPFCRTTPEGELILISDAFSLLTGYARKELLGKKFPELFSRQADTDHPKKRRDSSALLPVPFNADLLFIKKDQSKKWFRCNASNVYDENSNPTEIIVLLTDITEHKIAEQELGYAKKLAERAQLAQQQFLANMSHEIRTPLNAIIGMTYLLDDTSLNTEQQEYVHVLKNASSILLGLINDVLDLAKIEAGKQEVQRREFNLPMLLYSLMDTFRFKLKEKSVKFTLSIDPDINTILIGDDVLLNQILINILGNAEKFTPKGEINLHVQIVNTIEKTIWIQFEIEDMGIGIPADRLEEIFGEFVQADDNIHLRYGGSGLGLAICKRLVEMQGGEIHAKSVLNKGTTFTFSLPFFNTQKQIELRREGFKVQGPKDLELMENVRVLVVEDNAMNLKYLSSLLIKYHIAFDAVGTAKLALEKTKTQYYDLILLDMKLPGMSGIALAEQIRNEDNPNAATPMVLVSALAVQATLDSALEAGVNELLPKPYTPEQLITILRKYLSEEEDHPEEDVLPENSFVFDQRLDTQYLNKLYAGNCTYAVNLFQLFLEAMQQEWEELRKCLKEKDWTALEALVHKIKPNFFMVGLTAIGKMVQQVYDCLHKGQLEEAMALLNHVESELQGMLPIVRHELNRMHAFLEETVS